MLTADTITDAMIRALRDESRELGDFERVRCCNAALGLPTSDGALGRLDQRVCRVRIAAILENARQCGALHHYGADPVVNVACEGHPAGEYDPMGRTVYCDGSCRGRSA